jgi:tungstate transport system ATP-binding protein
MNGPGCVLELANLEVHRGGVRVLEVPSFRLHQNEFVSLIGPNGSGKSTLLLSMMCLLDRTGGQVFYRGRAVVSEREAIDCRRRMAMILQEPLLFDATVYDNVASGLRLRGLERGEVRRRVASYLERFSLLSMAHRSARKLSGGEARRVSLARALAVEPEMIFLDEPFANLDQPTRRSLTADLERSIRQAGMAAILVTHDRAEALHLSDRIVVMDRGTIVQSDLPSVVMNSPVNEFVAGWAGMETVLEGTVSRKVGWEITISVAGREIETIGEAVPGDPVYCCIPPESVIIDVTDPAGTSSARNVFPARISGVSSAGSFVKVKLDCGFPLVANVTDESLVSLHLEPGKHVFASFKATAIHVIPKGERRPTATGGGK